jgi:hypothetical protein
MIMKATIHIDGKEVFSSRKISAINLDKKVNELKIKYNCMKIADVVKRGFKVFTSK